jgi:ferredoxin
MPNAKMPGRTNQVQSSNIDLRILEFDIPDIWILKFIYAISTSVSLRVRKRVQVAVRDPKPFDYNRCETCGVCLKACPAEAILTSGMNRT